MATMQKERLLQFRGQDLCDRNGDKLGTIEEIYLDAETNEPEWALVNTGLFGTKSTFVPLRDASETEGKLQVAVDKQTIKDAPKMDPDGQLSQREEAELYRHYAMDYAETRSGSGLPDAGARGRFAREDADAEGERSRPDTDDEAMTRSEEELRVGTTQRETGRARLRKYVVTDEVKQTVPVQREEVRVEREPITDENRDAAMSGPDLSEAEHDVVLHSEEPVAEKRVVPKERVRLDKDAVTEERTVSEEVRREEVDVEGDVDREDR
jgi:uncharacterized protein (TIGR02271 family)